MPNTRILHLNPQVHERLHRIRTRMSLIARNHETSLGLEPTIAILIDHIENVPPDLDWLKQQVKLYPQRGRPRKSEGTELVPRVALRKDLNKGHELVWREADKHMQHRLFVCKHCSLTQDTYLNPYPQFPCPKVVGWSNIYVLKQWTRKELLDLQFSEAEVEWAAPNPEEPPTA